MLVNKQSIFCSIRAWLCTKNIPMMACQHHRQSFSPASKSKRYPLYPQIVYDMWVRTHISQAEVRFCQNFKGILGLPDGPLQLLAAYWKYKQCSLFHIDCIYKKCMELSKYTIDGHSVCAEFVMMCNRRICMGLMLVNLILVGCLATGQPLLFSLLETLIVECWCNNR